MCDYYSENDNFGVVHFVSLAQGCKTKYLPPNWTLPFKNDGKKESFFKYICNGKI